MLTKTSLRKVFDRYLEACRNVDAAINKWNKEHPDLTHLYGHILMQQNVGNIDSYLAYPKFEVQLRTVVKVVCGKTDSLCLLCDLGKYYSSTNRDSVNGPSGEIARIENEMLNALSKAEKIVREYDEANKAKEAGITSAPKIDPIQQYVR